MNAPKTIILTLTWEDRGYSDADLRLGPVHVGSVYEGNHGNWRASSRQGWINHMSNHDNKQAAMDAMEAAVMELAQ